MPISVVALVAAYNEADIIEHTVADLINQGVQVYLLDDGSTDGTADAVRHLVGHGLLAIEQFSPAGASRFEWRRILARKEQLATELDADWIIHHDADELREPPWFGMTFAESVELVDRMGWSAIDFAVFNFVPTHDTYRRGDNLRQAFAHFEGSQPFDRLQIKCWRRQPAIDLVSTGGHEVRFPGRSVFPIRFLLRHYPFRGQEQAERKVFAERRTRFVAEELAHGWHVQYDDIQMGHRFVRDPSTLTVFDPVQARIEMLVRHRAVEEADSEIDRLRETLKAMMASHDRRTAQLQRDLTDRTGQLESLQRALVQLEYEMAQRSRDVGSRRTNWT